MSTVITSRKIRALRTLRTAAWLGWQVEGNWADPFLFVGITLLRPIATALIISVVYGVLQPGAFATPVFAGVYIGNVFWTLVGQVTSGISWSIMEDREQYRTMKYIYTSPASFMVYLVGRGAARILIGLAAGTVILLGGIFILGVHIDAAVFNPLLMAYAIVCGLLILMSIGLILAGVSLRLARHGAFIGEALAGGLFVFSGAVFPLTVLPQWLQVFSSCLPVSWWIECIKRSFIGGPGHGADAALSFPSTSTDELVVILSLVTVFMTIAGALLFRHLERTARERGLIDAVVNY